MERIRQGLFTLQDVGYREFQCKLIPTVEKEKVIGVRTPALRSFAKKLYKEEPEISRAFLQELPHRYYDENNLHGALIGLMAKTPAEALDLIDQLLPYVDNWANCDMLPVKVFRKDLTMVRERIMPWLDSDQVYRVRFAIVTLLGYFLEDGFLPSDLERLAEIHTPEYYINMALAWYYSFALIKQYDQTIGLFESGKLEDWIHNKSIQKACESYRISPERKVYLKSLKKKGAK